MPYFDKRGPGTFAGLVKEQPKVKQELNDSVGCLVAEQKIVKIPWIGAGGGAGVVVEKATGKRSYSRISELQFGVGCGGRAQDVISESEGSSI
ncbi:MAG: hypothetical protein CV088_10495 [Nitrospira sp. LK70]|nr:hypothetical protein [Nitrospira sp. LK70]